MSADENIIQRAARECVDAILKPSSNAEEIRKLKKLKGNTTLGDYKILQKALVIGSGGLAGFIGGPIGLAAVVGDLVWCGKVAGQSCLGIGYILGRDATPDDLELILAIWTGVGNASDTVPFGKVGIAIGDSAVNYVDPAMKIGDTAVIKGMAKLGSKGAAKIGGKFSGHAITQVAGIVISQKVAL